MIVTSTTLTHEREYATGWAAAKAGKPPAANEPASVRQGRREFAYAASIGRDPHWTYKPGERKARAIAWGEKELSTTDLTTDP